MVPVEQADQRHWDSSGRPVMNDNTPRIPDPADLPEMSQRSLVIHWDIATNELWMDTSGFSVLEVPTLLRIALDLAEAAQPTPYFPDMEDEDSDD